MYTYKDDHDIAQVVLAQPEARAEQALLDKDLVALDILGRHSEEVAVNLGPVVEPQGWAQVLQRRHGVGVVCREVHILDPIRARQAFQRLSKRRQGVALLPVARDRVREAEVAVAYVHQKVRRGLPQVFVRC